MTASTRRVSTPWGSLLGAAALGVAAAIIGLLPWLVTGARLPLQNLWQREVLPEDMPRVLVPLVQYGVLEIVALLTAGGVLAGLLARRFRHAGRPAGAVLGGLVAGQGVAIAQSFATLRTGLGLNQPHGILEPSPGDPRAVAYWWGMLIGTLLVWAGVTLGAWLLSRMSRSPAALALVLAAIPLGSWVQLWLAAFAGPDGLPLVTGYLPFWTPVVVAALALAWCGFGSARCRLVWVVGFVILLVLPPVLAATTSALSTRLVFGDPQEMLAVGGEVLRAAAGVGVKPAVTALALAGVGVAVRTWWDQRSPGKAGMRGTP